MKRFAGNVLSNLDSNTRKISNVRIISSAKTDLFPNELIFKWSIIVLLALFYSLLFDFLMSFLEGELSSFWIPWSNFHPKLVKKVLKLLIRTETPVSFRCSLLLFKCPFELMLLFRSIPFYHIFSRSFVTIFTGDAVWNYNIWAWFFHRFCKIYNLFSYFIAGFIQGKVVSANMYDK